jgi:Tol biopolymer transport system component
MNADGSGQTNLTRSPEDENWSWLSPNGQLIVFLATLNNKSDTWVMSADGSGKTNLTKTIGGVGDVAWRP